MKRLVSASLALLPCFLASCQLPAPAGMAPVPITADGQPAAESSIDNVKANETAAAIARGEVGNAISGTIELPINLRKLARFTNGAPPVTLHAFRVTGPVIRDAKVSLFWKDDHAIGYVVDGVPPDYPVVLAATIEPGVVVRTLVPEASAQRPARGQTIDVKSEMIVFESYAGGIIPPVGLGGIAEVIRQGGLAPASAAEANQLAAAEVDKVSATEWGRDMREAVDVATALRDLAGAQLGVAGALNSGNAASQSAPMLSTGVYAATKQVQEKLLTLSKVLSERAERGTIPPDASNHIARVASHLKEAAAADLPQLAAVVPVSRRYSLSQSPLLSIINGVAVTQSQRRLMELYDQIGFIATANTGFEGPNGKPFSEAEIEQAFADGKGPYRTTCSQVNFYGDTTCKIVTNPLDRSREVLLSREADYLTKKLLELDEALASAANIFDDPKVATILFEHPAVANFIADDRARWTSPVGTWRIRLLQDVGADVVGGAGFAVMTDAEMFISAPEERDGTNTTTASSGKFVGVLAIWTPSTASQDNLNNFALRFNWDAEDKTLTEGELRGERRDFDDAGSRADYTATFNATMYEGNRISGYWFNRDRGMAGRFEMIRGTARYTI